MLMFATLQNKTNRGEYMIKIKVSYENKEQIEKVIELLHKHIHSFKISRNEKGQYKKAYIELDI